MPCLFRYSFQLYRLFVESENIGHAFLSCLVCLCFVTHCLSVPLLTLPNSMTLLVYKTAPSLSVAHLFPSAVVGLYRCHSFCPCCRYHTVPWVILPSGFTCQCWMMTVEFRMFSTLLAWPLQRPMSLRGRPCTLQSLLSQRSWRAGSHFTSQ